VGWLGIGEVTRDILIGKYKPSGDTVLCTIDLILELAQKEATKEYSRTSSVFEILHFGLLKARSHNSLIVEFDTMMTDIAMKTGYTPKRWWMAIDALFIKKEGITLVESLRNMILFAVDV
jgi:hypothetical protein